ncbi:sla2 Src-like adaptor 2 [Metarhizium acridum]|nr:sla2 Src-like adaptor 2 [Metarhizium acridum]
MIRERGQDDEQEDYTKLGAHEFKVREMEQQVEILKLENSWLQPDIGWARCPLSMSKSAIIAGWSLLPRAQSLVSWKLRGISPRAAPACHLSQTFVQETQRISQDGKFWPDLDNAKAGLDLQPSGFHKDLQG